MGRRIARQMRPARREARSGGRRTRRPPRRLPPRRGIRRAGRQIFRCSWAAAHQLQRGQRRQLQRVRLVLICLVVVCRDVRHSIEVKETFELIRFWLWLRLRLRLGRGRLRLDLWLVLLRSVANQRDDLHLVHLEHEHRRRVGDLLLVLHGAQRLHEVVTLELIRRLRQLPQRARPALALERRDDHRARELVHVGDALHAVAPRDGRRHGRGPAAATRQHSLSRASSSPSQQLAKPRQQQDEAKPTALRTKLRCRSPCET